MTDKEAIDTLQSMVKAFSMDCRGPEDTRDVDALQMAIARLKQPALQMAIARLKQPAPAGDLVSLRAVLACVDPDVHGEKTAHWIREDIRALPRHLSVAEVGRRLEAYDWVDVVLDEGPRRGGPTLPEALAALLTEIE